MEIVLMTIDWQQSTVTFLRSDGKTATFDIEARLEPTSAIVRMTRAPSVPLLYVETNRGDEIVAELATTGSEDPRRRRPVIYLDQKDWSTLANTIHRPDKVRQPDELAAARRVIELANAREIILPLSAGHMSETCKWTDNDARYRLALTMLQLSSGWVMRDPLDVRRFELRQTLTVRYKQHDPVQPPVFTLDPEAIHGETRGMHPYQPPPDISADAAFDLRTLVGVSSNFDTLLDGERVDMPSAHGWADRLQQFTDWLGTEPKNDHLRRKRTNLMFTSDIGTELAEEAHRAGLTPEQMSEWTMTQSDTDLDAMPSLGLFREVLREKLLNPETRWESNDLTDLMYLTCAAGYADHVVGENSLIAQMEQALRRLGRTTRVHRNLAGLVAVL